MLWLKFISHPSNQGRYLNEDFMNHNLKKVAVASFLLAFSGLSIDGEKCSPISKTCFEWPLIPDGTKLERMSTNGVWSKPEGDGPFPAVLIAESCGGSKDTVNKFWPEYYNSLGYATYTPRLLEPMGQKRCPNFKWVIKNENRAEMVKRLYSALDDLADKPYVDKNKISIAGYSLGAILIRDFLEIKDMNSPEGNQFNKAIMVYGNCTLMDRRGPDMPTIMIQSGKELNANGKGYKRKFCDKVKNAGFSNFTYHELENAYHAWDVKKFKNIFRDIAGTEMLYSEEETKKSQEIIKAFLQQ